MSQKLLMQAYRSSDPAHRPSFREAGFSVYSQHDEDGILLYIFSLIGMKSCQAIEICAGNGIECNSANLLINHRWTGLLVDGQESNVTTARQFYAAHPATAYWSPQIVHAWITRENVDQVIAAAGYSGEVDLLSIDVDGIDYWLWEAISVVSARVVVLEYNHLLGPGVSVTVPYRPDFVAEFSEHGSDYAGASLQAFVKLGIRKGYRFVGTNAIGTNAFFVQASVAESLLPEANPEDAFRHPRAQFGMTVRYERVRAREWVEV